MVTKNFLYGLIAALVILCSFSSVQAEIKIYTGVGEHYMESESETLAQAQDAAKLAAELNAMEQAQINVKSYSAVHNSNLTQDEIITITAGIMNITSVKYSLKEDFDGLMVMCAEVTAEIDTDKIAELVEREIKRRAA